MRSSIVSPIERLGGRRTIRQPRQSLSRSSPRCSCCRPAAGRPHSARSAWLPFDEVAQMVNATEESVNSALKRARATLRQRAPVSGTRNVAPLPKSPDEQTLVERFTRAFQAADIEALVALLTEDVWISMPPIPFEWQGHERARDVFRAVLQPGQLLLA